MAKRGLLDEVDKKMQDRHYRWFLSYVLPPLFALLVLGFIFCPGCKKKKRTAQREELRSLVSAEHKCDQVKILKFKATRGTSYWWATLDVCGVKRFYEQGKWCEDCSYSWRERKAKGTR